MLAASAAALVALGPVENKNKVLDDVEKVVYRRRMLRNLAIVSTVVVGLVVFGVHDFATAALCGVVLSAATAVVGVVKSG